MNNDVGIIGVCQSNHDKTKRNVALSDLIFEVTTGALNDARVGIDEIDSVVIAAHDQIDGRPITTMVNATAAGAYLKDEIRVADDGAFGLALACLRLLSGKFNLSLVVSWSKCSECDPELVSKYSFDPFLCRPFALNNVTAHAIQAMSYMDKWGINEDQVAKVVVKNRTNGAKNRFAHLRSSVTEQEVLESKLLSYPVRQLHMPPYSDGACALVLGRKEVIDTKQVPVAWIRGMGWAQDTYYMGDKELSALPSLSLASRMAYRVANIANPLEDLDIAEVHDITAFHELMAYEALGFCEQGEGGRFIDSGIPFIEGKLPVNSSGGAMSANPYSSTGLIRIAEGALQVMGRAGDSQIPNVNCALSHGVSGIGGQSHCVAILNS